MGFVVQDQDVGDTETRVYLSEGKDSDCCHNFNH